MLYSKFYYTIFEKSTQSFQIILEKKINKRNHKIDIYLDILISLLL